MRSFLCLKTFEDVHGSDNLIRKQGLQKDKPKTTSALNRLSHCLFCCSPVIKYKELEVWIGQHFGGGFGVWRRRRWKTHTQTDTLGILARARGIDGGGVGDYVWSEQWQINLSVRLIITNFGRATSFLTNKLRNEKKNHRRCCFQTNERFHSFCFLLQQQ